MASGTPFALSLPKEPGAVISSILQIALVLIPSTDSSSNCSNTVKHFVAFEDQQQFLGRMQALHNIFKNSNYSEQEIEIFHTALERMFERNERIPQARFLSRFNFSEERNTLSAENSVIENAWERLIPQREIIQTFDSFDLTGDFRMIRNKSASEGMTIEAAEIRNTPMILRTQRGRSELGAVRKTAAAARLNEILQLNTVPKARWIRIFDRTSLASAFVQGTTPTAFVRSHFDPWSVADMEGFEFLIGQTDGSELNAKECSDSTLRVFDHDQAFLTSIPRRSDFCIAGAKLPGAYSQRFARSLKGLRRDQIVRQLGHVLTLDEIDFIMLRREILLVDIERNQDRKLLYGP
jgi:hypothetical protein